MMQTYDTHAHLDHLEDIDKALTEASAAGVSGIVGVSVDLASSRKNLEIKRKHSQPKIFIALGIHPGDIKEEEVDETIEFIRANIKEVVAIGETGLDYWYKWVRKDQVERAKQHRAFARQLQLSKEFDLPVIIHSRGAWRDCLAMTKEAGVKKALFHWYSGPLDYLEEILAAGYYVSTSPSLAYSPQSREAIAHAPIERTLIETDCPVHYKDGDERYQAGPKDVFRTLKAYCELKQIPPDEAVEIFNANTRTFFGLR